MLNELQRELEHVAQMERLPVVVWSRTGETELQLAMRCAQHQLDGKHRILAAVPYGFKVPPGVQAVEFIPKAYEALTSGLRNIVLPGGRGSGKTVAGADWILLRMLSESIRVCGGREYQTSIRESVLQVMKDRIAAHKLWEFFETNEREVTCPSTGSEMFFIGLNRNIDSLRSYQGISIFWFEEADCAKQQSLAVISPTIRVAGSQLLFTLNPNKVDAPIMEYTKGDRPDVALAHLIYSDNPWFKETALEVERERMERVDPDAYAWIWLGQCRVATDAQVYKGKYFVESFEPVTNSSQFGKNWAGPYFGADFGFSVDPTALIRSWIFERTLYIDHEAYGLRVDLDRTAALFDQVPGACKSTIRADSARPDVISYLQRHGCPKIVGVKKGPGSVDAGVMFIRSFDRIVIHPRCRHTIEEFRLYSFATDRLTGDPTVEILDRHNHLQDSLRYSLEPLIRARGSAKVSHLYL